MSADLEPSISGVTAVLKRCWRCRWPSIRLALAATLLATTLADIPSLVTRRRIAAMPGYDYAREAEALHGNGRYGEALLVIDAGFADSDAEHGDRLADLRQKVIADRESWFRRAREFGIGALIGEGQSLESIMGAITADMFVVGDVRDLVIQSGRYVADGDCDEFILSLSAVGVATTILPGVDWAPALLKVGRKVGAVGERLADALIVIVKRAVSGGDVRTLQTVMADTATLSRRLTPGGFLRVLRHVDDPDSLAKLARYSERYSDGAFAIYRSGPDGVRIVTRGDNVAAEALLLVSKKGDEGLAWLRHNRARLLRPHPLLGLTKSLWKGNLHRGLLHLQQLLDRYVWVVLPALLLWAVAECLLVRRTWRDARSTRAQPQL